MKVDLMKRLALGAFVGCFIVMFVMVLISLQDGPQNVSFSGTTIINAFLAVINAVYTPQFWWVLFPLFFWGIGIFIKFLNAFIIENKFNTVEYRERKIQEEMAKLGNES